MKKLLLLCCMTAMWFVSAAQSKGVLTLPDRGKMQWNVNAGVLFNGVAGSNKLTQKAQWEDDGEWNGSFPALIGYDISIGFDKSYGKSPLYGGLYINFGSAGYRTKATKSSDNPYTSSTGTQAGSSSYREKIYTLDMYNVSLSPTLIGYKYEINKSMMVYAHCGGFASYNLFGNWKYDYCQKVHYYYDGSNKNSNDNEKTKISDMEGLSKFDAGLNLGAGFYYGHFNIGFSWIRGFIPINKGGSETIKIGKDERKIGNLYENDFRISIGYTF